MNFEGCSKWDPDLLDKIIIQFMNNFIGKE
jgi:hypothetical protein